MSDIDDESEQEPPAPDHVVDAEEMMYLGLQIARYTLVQIQRVSDKTNLQNYKDHFGASPCVCCVVYSDLQLTDIEEAKLRGNQTNLVWFLKALYFLRCYPKESRLASILNLSIRWGRDPLWSIVRRIQALKTVKITWPEDFGTDRWAGTVDGTDMALLELKHPEYTYDTQAFGHKHNRASYTYELVISLGESRIIQMSGPHKSGETNDKGRFKEHGLKELLEECGMKVIGDRGYNGYPDLISTYNAFDSRPVRKFKSRALRRHEKVNGKLKVFEVLSTVFRSKGPQRKDRFASCFEACAVLTQYKMEIDEPLYDILIEDILNDSTSDSSSDWSDAEHMHYTTEGEEDEE